MGKALQVSLPLLADQKMSFDLGNGNGVVADISSC